MAALRLVHVVGGHQYGGAPFAEIEQFLPEIAPVLRIHRRGGFVEQQQVRMVDHCRRQRQPLLLAAAHGTGPLPRQRRQFIGLQQRVQARRQRLASHAVNAPHKLQIFPGRQLVIEGELLGHVADPAPERFGLFRNAQTQHLHLSRRGSEQAGQHAQCGGFAAAVGAEKTVDLPSGHAEIQPVHRQKIAKAPADPLGTDRQLTHERTSHRQDRPAAASRSADPAPRRAGLSRPDRRVGPCPVR